LAGSGLRIAEALGLDIGKHLSPDCSMVFVRQQRRKKLTGIEPYPKTDLGFRDVDIDPALAQLLKNYIGNRKTGLLFQTTGSLPLFPRNKIATEIVAWCTSSPICLATFMRALLGVGDDANDQNLFQSGALL
jgi:integrase